MTHREALDYELRSSPLARWMGKRWWPVSANDLLSSYFEWKVNRKMARYNRSNPNRPTGNRTSP